MCKKRNGSLFASARRSWRIGDGWRSEWSRSSRRVGDGSWRWSDGWRNSDGLALDASVAAHATLDLLRLLVVSELAAWRANVLVAVVVDVVDSRYVSRVVVVDEVVADENAIDVMVVTVDVVEDDTIVQNVIVVVSQLLLTLLIVLVAAARDRLVLVGELTVLDDWRTLGALLSARCWRRGSALRSGVASPTTGL